MLKSALANRGQAVRQAAFSGWDQVGLGEVVAFEEEDSAGLFCQGVAEAVTEVEACRAVASSVFSPGFVGELGLVLVERDGSNSTGFEELVELRSSFLSEPGFCDHAAFNQRRCGDDRIGVGGDRVDKPFSLGFPHQDGHQGRGIDDHDLARKAVAAVAEDVVFGPGIEDWQ